MNRQCYRQEAAFEQGQYRERARGDGRREEEDGNREGKKEREGEEIWVLFLSRKVSSAKKILVFSLENGQWSILTGIGGILEGASQPRPESFRLI